MIDASATRFYYSLVPNNSFKHLSFSRTSCIITDIGTPPSPLRDENLNEISFAKALNNAKAVVSIQDDSMGDTLFTLSRAWCVFEMQIAKLNKKAVTYVCTGGEVSCNA